MTTPKRKTRLKGTETRKPCFDCGKTKDRFKDFKPRWAGCATHRTERGRRYFEPGCADCDAKVNGNIRQPRCIECDKARPKKRKAKTSATAPKPKAKAASKPKAGPVAKVNPSPEPKAAPVAEATPVSVPEPKKGKTPKTSQKPKRKIPANMADLSALFAQADADADAAAAEEE